MKRNTSSFLSIIALLALMLTASFVNAQTRIELTVLARPGANNTQLYTNGSGSVLWGDADSYLSGAGGNVVVGNVVELDFVGLGNIGTTPDPSDVLLINDGTNKTVTFAQLLSGVSFTLSDGTNTQTLNNTNTLLFSSTGSDGYDFTVGATDQVTFSYDFTELTNLATVDGATDRLLILDASTGTYNYITTSQITGAGTDFVISDGTNTQNVGTGETILFEDVANGIDVVISATNKVTTSLDINELTAVTPLDFAADYIPVYDASAGAVRKTLIGSISVAPTKAHVDIISNTAANANIASGLTLADYREIWVYLDGVWQNDTFWNISGNNIQFTFATLAGQTLGIQAFK